MYIIQLVDYSIASHIAKIRTHNSELQGQEEAIISDHRDRVQLLYTYV